MRALDPEVVDALWAALEPLLPPPERSHPLGWHRPRASDRLCFRSLLIRLVTGASWVDIEAILDFQVSDMTAAAPTDATLLSASPPRSSSSTASSTGTTDGAHPVEHPLKSQGLLRFLPSRGHREGGTMVRHRGSVAAVIAVAVLVVGTIAPSSAGAGALRTTVDRAPAGADELSPGAYGMAMSPVSGDLCVLIAGGTVRCRIGTETFATVGGLVGATDITMGGGLGLGHQCALIEDGTVRCWGDNSYGQLGDGTNQSRAQPTTVTGLSGAVAVDAGLWATCALLIGGTVSCWGFNSSPVPTPVVGLTDVTSVSVDGGVGCALIEDGTVECWGDNSAGQLGDGTTDFRAVPSPVLGLTDVVAIDVGGYRVCAVVIDGTVHCWGATDDHWAIGPPLPHQIRTRPELVTGLAGATAVRAGLQHNCALAAGTVMCWGHNSSGQIGDGTTTYRAIPTAAVGVSGVTTLAVGFTRTCAVAVGGTVWCWGNGNPYPFQVQGIGPPKERPRRLYVARSPWTPRAREVSNVTVATPAGVEEFNIESVLAWSDDGRLATTSLPVASDDFGVDFHFDFSAEKPGFYTILVSGSVPDTGEEMVGWTSVRVRPSAVDARFVALGDSFSSGEGYGDNLPFDANTAYDDGRGCHRSRVAYSRQLHEMRPTLPTPELWACSGARVRNFYQPVHTDVPQRYCAGRRPSQADPECSPVLPPPDDGVEILTLSIGGNDAGFIPIVKECLRLRNVTGISGPIPTSAGDCAGEISRRREGLDGHPSLDDQIGKVVALLQDLNRLAPSAQIYILGYPELFNGVTPQDCTLRGVDVVTGTVYMPGRHKHLIDDVERELNRKLRRATARFPNVHYVDWYAATTGHHLCSSDPYLHGIRFTPGNKTRGGEPIDQGSFHPNPAGYRAAAEALRAEIDRVSVTLRPAETRPWESPPVPPGAEAATFRASIPGSEVGLTLVAPSGQRFEQGDPAVEWLESHTGVVAVMPSPEAGVWTVEVHGVDVDPDGEPVTMDMVADVPADEAPVVELTATTDPGAPAQVTFTASVPGELVSGRAFEWDVDGDGEVDDVTMAPTITTTLDVGAYRPAVFVTAPDSPSGVGSLENELVIGTPTPPPIAADDSAQVNDTAVVVDVTRNDVNVDIDATIHILEETAHGSAVVAGQSIGYTPEPGFVGDDHLLYLVCTAAGCGSAVVTFRVGSVPDVPGAPGAPIVGAVRADEVMLSWAPPVGSESITSYVVEAYVPSSVTPAVSHSTHDATPSLSFTGLEAGTPYRFRATAINGGGAGPASTYSAWTLPPFRTIDQSTDRQFRDFTGRAPTAAELSVWRTDLTTGATTIIDRIAELNDAPGWGGTRSPLVRLYRAYFLRHPDFNGLEYWVERRHGGTGIHQVSQAFALSPEFRERYGSLTNRQFVLRVYQNVLGRVGESAGVDYWTRQLDSGTFNRGRVMIGFSESPEHRLKTAASVDATNFYTGMLRRRPTAAEYATWAPPVGTAPSRRDLVGFLLSSDDYGDRTS